MRLLASILASLVAGKSWRRYIFCYIKMDTISAYSASSFMSSLFFHYTESELE